jgi:hypothetical protein
MRTVSSLVLSPTNIQFLRRPFHDLHLLREKFEDILLEEKIPNSEDGLEVELGAEMVEHVGSTGCVLAVLTERRDGGPVGARADEDLPEIFSIEVSILTDIEVECVGDGVNEEVKELVFVYFTVCLLGRRHTFSKQTSQLIGFAKY